MHISYDMSPFKEILLKNFPILLLDVGIHVTRLSRLSSTHSTSFSWSCWV